MTKQEEIKKELFSWADDGCMFLDKHCEHRSHLKVGGYCSSNDGSYKCLMERLSDIGVVIYKAGHREFNFDDMVVEPLVKDKAISLP